MSRRPRNDTGSSVSNHPVISLAAETILQDYVEACTADMQRLEQAWKSHDLDEVRRQAHRIKGASGMVGAKQLAHLAARIETLAMSEAAGGDGLQTLVAAATAALAQVSTAGGQMS